MDENDYKKPGAPAAGWRAWFKNYMHILYVTNMLHFKFWHS